MSKPQISLFFLLYLFAKNFHNRSKFDKVMTKNKFAQFFEARCIEGIWMGTMERKKGGRKGEQTQRLFAMCIDVVGWSISGPQIAWHLGYCANR